MLYTRVQADSVSYFKAAAVVSIKTAGDVCITIYLLNECFDDSWHNFMGLIMIGSVRNFILDTLHFLEFLRTLDFAAFFLKAIHFLSVRNSKLFTNCLYAVSSNQTAFLNNTIVSLDYTCTILFNNLIKINPYTHTRARAHMLL